GYDVVGIAMRLAPESSSPPASRRQSTCCSHEDFEDARRVAELMGFPFYVIDLREEFATRVMGNFVSEYLDGRTPNPCVMCNREIKFNRLWQRARAIEADFIATGHYARIDCDAGGTFHLLRARDDLKDQSYFLFALTQRELARTLFPLGMLTKNEVRDRARALGLVNADKPESQEICFVPDGEYARFIEERSEQGQIRKGRLLDSQGGELGVHHGIHRFTVGQRRGLGVASREPLYVNQIDRASGNVIVGKRSELSSGGLRARDVSLVDPSIPQGNPIHIDVRVRYRSSPLPATVAGGGDGCAEVRFASRGPAVTPGQACVFYRGDEVLGGGFIEGTLEN